MIVKVSLHQDKAKQKVFVSLSILCLESKCNRDKTNIMSKLPQPVKKSSIGKAAYKTCTVYTEPCFRPPRTDDVYLQMQLLLYNILYIHCKTYCRTKLYALCFYIYCVPIVRNIILFITNITSY